MPSTCTESSDDEVLGSGQSDDSETAAEGPSSPPKRKRRWYFQSFMQEWLQDVALKDWLVADPFVKDRSTAMCKVCDVKFKHANKTALLNHKDTQKHNRNFNARKSNTQIQSFLKPKRRPQLFTIKLLKQFSSQDTWQNITCHLYR